MEELQQALQTARVPYSKDIVPEIRMSSSSSSSSSSSRNSSSSHSKDQQKPKKNKVTTFHQNQSNASLIEADFVASNGQGFVFVLYMLYTFPQSNSLRKIPTRRKRRKCIRMIRFLLSLFIFPFNHCFKVMMVTADAQSKKKVRTF